MADDDEAVLAALGRAEIESKLTRYLAVRLRTPEHASAYLAHDVLDFLDRVRDARGDDERFWCSDCGASEIHHDWCEASPGEPVGHGNRQPPAGAVRAKLESIIDHNPPTWVTQMVHDALKLLAARSPQDEDHEAGIEAAARAEYERSIAEPYTPGHGALPAFDDVPDDRKAAQALGTYGDASWNRKRSALADARRWAAYLSQRRRTSMTDDKRQAEIEAVAQAIRESLWSTWGANRQTTDWPTDGDLHVAARAALDRVRDARSDDEADDDGARQEAIEDEMFVVRGEHRDWDWDRDRSRILAEAERRVSERWAARSPQGEDHDELEAAYKRGYDIGRIDEKEAAIKAGVFRYGGYVPSQGEDHEAFGDPWGDPGPDGMEPTVPVSGTEPDTTKLEAARVALDAFWQVRDETQDNVQAMRAALAAARSPQDESEDHKAGVEAVAVIINRTRGESIPVDDDDRHEAREAIDAYLSRVSPSRAGSAWRTEAERLRGVLSLIRAAPEHAHGYATAALSVPVPPPVSGAEPDTAKLVEALRDPRLDGPLDRAASAYLRERESAGTAGGAARRIVTAFLAGFSVDAEKPKENDV